MNKLEKEISKIETSFEKLEGEDKWFVLVMLLGSFLINDIKEDHYEACLDDIKEDVLKSVSEFENRNDLESLEPEGNA